MIKSTTANDRPRREVAATKAFLESPNDESFTELFLTFTPQLVSFFRSHGCSPESSENLSQEVMLTVHRKAGQLREGRTSKMFNDASRGALHRHSNLVMSFEEKRNLLVPGAVQPVSRE